VAAVNRIDVGINRGGSSHTCEYVAFHRGPLRALRIVAATLNAVIGAYLLLNTYGISAAMLERGTVWEGTTPLPSYPVTHMVAYLTVTFVLQCVSGWLLTPAASRRDKAGFWGQYMARVSLCIGACVVAAFLMIGVVMSLLDAGVI
jgi:hypothetical protein